MDEEDLIAVGPVVSVTEVDGGELQSHNHVPYSWSLERNILASEELCSSTQNIYYMDYVQTISTAYNTDGGYSWEENLGNIFSPATTTRFVKEVLEDTNFEVVM